MTPQAMGFEYRKRCEERAAMLQRFFREQTDCEPLMEFKRELKSVTYTDPSGIASPLVVDGTTWKDFYVNLCTVQEAIGFAVMLRPAEDDWEWEEE